MKIDENELYGKILAESLAIILETEYSEFCVSLYPRTSKLREYTIIWIMNLILKISILV